jgi:cell division septum initiation protein DivIVA
MSFARKREAGFGDEKSAVVEQLQQELLQVRQSNQALRSKIKQADQQIAGGK